MFFLIPADRLDTELVRRAGILFGCYSHLDLPHDGFCHFVQQAPHVREIALVSLSPQNWVRRRIDKLRDNTHPSAGT